MTTTNEGTQRDELVSLLWCKIVAYGGAGAHVRLDANAAHAVAGAVLTAGYRKPRTITTVEELDVLPVEAVVRSDMGNVYIKDHYVDDPADTWWATGGDVSVCQSSEIALPVTVLYEPEAEVGA